MKTLAELKDELNAVREKIGAGCSAEIDILYELEAHNSAEVYAARDNIRKEIGVLQDEARALSEAIYQAEHGKPRPFFYAKADALPADCPAMPYRVRNQHGDYRLTGYSLNADGRPTNPDYRGPNGHTYGINPGDLRYYKVVEKDAPAGTAFLIARA